MLNATARLVYNSMYDRISQLLGIYTRWPEHIQFHLAIVVFCCRNQTAPEYLARDLQSADDDISQTTTICHNSQAGCASQSHMAPHIWRSCIWCYCTFSVELSTSWCHRCIVRCHLQTAFEDLFVHIIVRRLPNCYICCYLSLKLSLRQTKYWHINNNNNNSWAPSRWKHSSF